MILILRPNSLRKHDEPCPELSVAKSAAGFTMDEMHCFSPNWTTLSELSVKSVSLIQLHIPVTEPSNSNAECPYIFCSIWMEEMGERPLRIVL